MSGPRTVTVHTADHGDVTLPEPTWCLGEHAEQNGGHRADISHDGPEMALEFEGRELLSAGLVAYPFAERLARGPVAAVDLGGDWHSLDADGLRALAARLVVHAGRLRDLASELAALERAGDGGAA